MNIDSAFPSNYLKASDIGDKEPVVTIDRVEFEAVGREREMKPVVYFQGKTKGIVLNKTNGNKIAALTGSKDTEDWAGCQIKLYATETEFGGETVECIRIKAAGTAAKAAKPKPEPVAVSNVEDDEIPF